METEKKICPKCNAEDIVKHGIVKGKQRFLCKICNYKFTVFKEGKKTDQETIAYSMQLHMEGLSFRAIERVVGISHVTIINWVKLYQEEIRAIKNSNKSMIEKINELRSMMCPIDSSKKLKKSWIGVIKSKEFSKKKRNKAE